MKTSVLASLVGIAAAGVAFGGPALSSDDEATGAMGAPPEGAPDHTFLWDDVAAADAPPRINLDTGAEGTCRGHIRSHISIDAAESGVKSLTLAPVPGETCVFDVLALHRQGSDADDYRMATDAAMLSAGCCTVPATFGPPESSDTTVGTSSKADTDADGDIAVTTWCRIGDGWAHTGYPDPPTVVYTRVYHEMEFCYDEDTAAIEAYQGVCFANPATLWYTDAEECYWSDADVGPSTTVYLTIHGYFEKDVNAPYYPSHDMWHTVHGDAGTGRVYCTGDIIGEYDGYATTNNCGAASPEPRLR